MKHLSIITSFAITILLAGGLFMAQPTPTHAGFFSWIKSFFVSEEHSIDEQNSAAVGTPDVSQDPDAQAKQLTEEQKQKQREAQQEVEILKQELAEVQAQIEAEVNDGTNDDETNTTQPTIKDTTLDELKSLETRLLTRIGEVEDLSRKLAQNNLRAIGLTGKIDNLSGTTLNNAEFTGTVTGLTDAHIPNDITVSNYLSSSGGTISGTLSVSASTTFNGVEYGWPSSDGSAGQVLSTNGAGVLSWGGGGAFTSSGGSTVLSNPSDNVGIGTSSPYAKLSVVGETVSSYFTATSTTATSTFLGDISVDSNIWACDGACPTLTATSSKGNIYTENAMTFGNGFSINDISSTELGVFDSNGNAVVIFDE